MGLGEKGRISVELDRDLDADGSVICTIYVTISFGYPYMRTASFFYCLVHRLVGRSSVARILSNNALSFFLSLPLLTTMYLSAFRNQ